LPGGPHDESINATKSKPIHQPDPSSDSAINSAEAPHRQAQKHTDEPGGNQRERSRDSPSPCPIESGGGVQKARGTR
jgi:hypothetical protein